MSNYFRSQVERMAPPGADDTRVERIEVDFAIPVWISPEQAAQFHQAIRAIVTAPANTPRDGVHWVSGYGSKPQLSDRDAQFLGKRPEPGGPPDGAEPAWDDTVAYWETTARPFLDEAERARHPR